FRVAACCVLVREPVPEAGVHRRCDDEDGGVTHVRRALGVQHDDEYVHLATSAATARNRRSGTNSRNANALTATTAPSTNSDAMPASRATASPRTMPSCTASCNSFTFMSPPSVDWRQRTSAG